MDLLSSDEDMLDIAHAGTTTEGGHGDNVQVTAKPESRQLQHQPLDSEDYYGRGAVGTEDDLGGVPGLGQYDDFHTIDWQRDIARDRMRHR